MFDKKALFAVDYLHKLILFIYKRQKIYMDIK